MPKGNPLFLAVSCAAVVLTLGLALPLMAQEHPATVTPNSVWVGADGKFEAEPDTVLVQFNISAQDEKLQNANDRATKAAEQVRQLLRANGLDPKDAQFSRFAIEPMYDYQNPKRKLVGYRVESDISLKFKDFTKVGPITQGLADIDVANQSLSYILEDEDAAKLKAVADALRRARDEADTVAHGSGRNLGELSYASVDTYERSPQPRPMMMAAAPMGKAASAPPAPTEGFGAQKITVTAHVNALYNFK